MSNLDTMIARDLAALGENSRRDLPALDDALRTTDAYRDDRPGAEARRNALADERRRELVLMPLTLAHVFAHRVGRAAAGGAAIVCSFVLVAMLVDPLLMRFAAYLVPGLNIGMLGLIAALVIVAAYVVASWIGEAHFARKMRDSIKTGDDAYRDLDHLARGPIEIAQTAVHKLDAWSIALFLAGAASITMVFGYIVVMVGTHHTLATAWSLTSLYDTGAVQRNIELVVFALVATGGTAVLAARSSTVARVLAGWPMLVIAAVTGFVTAYNAFHVSDAIAAAVVPLHHELPTTGARYLLAIGATMTVVLPLAWGTLFWRRREEAKIS